MAKLKGPLFSLGATQKLGDTLVFFGWKGLNVVREYVIPSNPKTTAQKLQRSYLTAAVAKIHYCQAFAARVLVEIDTMAYALWGSTFPTPRTWFNQAVKNWVDQKVAGKLPLIYHGGQLTPAATQITFMLHFTVESGITSKFDVYWGTSKTALVNKQEVTTAQIVAGVAITGMPKSTKIFLQVRCTTPNTFLGSNSGIYYAKTLAA